MTKTITIALSFTFIGILAIAAAVVWYNNATAQPPGNQSLGVLFPAQRHQLSVRQMIMYTFYPAISFINLTQRT